jgi:branched-subunit amino acid aminotransferase/4-amino-4-deoxychorismate lyase
MIKWKAAEGWGAPEIVASGPIGLHPFSHVFHYAIEVHHPDPQAARVTSSVRTPGRGRCPLSTRKPTPRTCSPWCQSVVAGGGGGGVVGVTAEGWARSGRGAQCYEGMKAYIDSNGKTRLFRPNKNMERFNNSAARLNLPTFDGHQLLECIKELLRIDKAWIPTEAGYSMYLRPVMFSTTPWLGLTQCRCVPHELWRPRARLLLARSQPITTIRTVHLPSWPCCPSAQQQQRHVRRVAGRGRAAHALTDGRGGSDCGLICSEAMIFVLCSPVGPYFKSGFVPIKLSVDSKYIRAWPGGTGNVKFGGNYAPTVASIVQANADGCSQSLFVYDEDEWVTEAGTMNIFFLLTSPQGERQLWTPTLDDGCILPGITRLTTIEVAREWGECTVVEKRIPCREIIAALKEGRMEEMFGTGTAANLQPISGLRYKGVDYMAPADGMGEGSFQLRLGLWLKQVQYGEIPHEWSVVV